MAANYTIKTQRRTIQVLGGGDTLDVQEVGAVTRPSDVYFKVQVPYLAWIANRASEFLEPVASGIEGRIGDDFIAGAQYVEEVGPDNLLHGYIEFTVQIPGDASQTTTVMIPVALLAGTDTFVQQIVAEDLQAALTELEATAAL